jgi:hypothetical protein
MREVDAARRVSGFHTAAVVDADATAHRPWLVTAYIPASWLDQVIARHGPLQEPALYALGRGSRRRWSPSTRRMSCTVT